jgi:hypothetical protein
MIVDEDEVVLAKWLYETWSSIAFQDLGPAYGIPAKYQKIADLLSIGIEKISSTCNQIGTNIFLVPSPWHACLILSSLQNNFSREGTKILFRGQSDSSWTISPTISRTLNPIEEKKRCTIFRSILSTLCRFYNADIIHPSSKGNLKLNISDIVYTAIAQHYGLKTDLIDFTTDAAVASYFATSPVSSRKSDTSSIFCLPIDSAISAGLEIIFPPPLATRIYTQRGFFVKSEFSLDFTDLGMLEIRFPSKKYDEEFKIMRNGKVVIDLLQDTLPIDEILRFMDTLDYTESIENLTSKLSTSINTLKRDFRSKFCFLYDSPLSLWSEYIDFIEDQLYWIAYSADNGKFIVDFNILAKIARSNSEIFLSIIQLYLWFSKNPFNSPTMTSEKSKQLIFLAEIFQKAIDIGRTEEKTVFS